MAIVGPVWSGITRNAKVCLDSGTPRSSDGEDCILSHTQRSCGRFGPADTSQRIENHSVRCIGQFKSFRVSIGVAYLEVNAVVLSKTTSRLGGAIKLGSELLALDRKCETLFGGFAVAANCNFHRFESRGQMACYRSTLPTQTG